MNTTSKLAITGVLVYAGQKIKADRKSEEPSFKIVIGAAFVALFLAVLDGTNADLASKMASLILAGAFLTYIVPIVRATGLVK